MVTQNEKREGEKLTLTTNEASAMLGVHPVTMQRWIAAGKIRSFKLGAKRFISRRWLVTYIESGGDSADA